MPSLPSDRSRTRQRIPKPPPPVVVPDIQENAAERKRALSVLAQRRYRERKRLARIKAQTSREGPEQTKSASESEQAATSEYPSADLVNLPFSIPDNAGIQPTISNQEPSENTQLDLNLHLGDSSIQWLSCTLNDESGLGGFPLSLEGLAIDPHPLSPMLFDTSTPGGTSPTSALTFTPAPEDTASAGTDNAATPPGSMTSPSSIQTRTTSASSTSFPDNDSYHLSVPPLTLLRAFLRIATRLNAASSVLSLTATSPFNLGRAPPVSELPAAWQPTETQIVVPHHPVLDLLPWSGVRDRLIAFLSLELPTPSSGGDGDGNGNAEGGGGMSIGVGRVGTGSRLLDFVYDMEDGAEGIRVSGADPFDEGNWEVGQVLFERWWFVFDRDVVERSNRRRRERGVAPLRVTDGGGVFRWG